VIGQIMDIHHFINTIETMIKMTKNFHNPRASRLKMQFKKSTHGKDLHVM
jgi:hypothetical protein